MSSELSANNNVSSAYVSPGIRCSTSSRYDKPKSIPLHSNHLSILLTYIVKTKVERGLACFNPFRMYIGSVPLRPSHVICALVSSHIPLRSRTNSESEYTFFLQNMQLHMYVVIAQFMSGNVAVWSTVDCRNFDRLG